MQPPLPYLLEPQQAVNHRITSVLDASNYPSWLAELVHLAHQTATPRGRQLLPRLRIHPIGGGRYPPHRQARRSLRPRPRHRRARRQHLLPPPQITQRTPLLVRSPYNHHHAPRNRAHRHPQPQPRSQLASILHRPARSLPSDKQVHSHHGPTRHTRPPHDRRRALQALPTAQALSRDMRQPRLQQPRSSRRTLRRLRRPTTTGLQNPILQPHHPRPPGRGHPLARVPPTTLQIENHA